MIWEAAPGKHDNFGEAMVKYLLRNLGVEPIHPDPKSDNDVLMAVSSEFAGIPKMTPYYHKHLHVWGSANGHGPHYPYKGKCTAYAVRDVRAAHWNNLPNADTVLVADPTFCLPLFYQPTKKPNTGIWYAPHINNTLDTAEPRRRLQAKFFDVRIDYNESLEERFDELANAEFVFTNALHIMLFCFAYKVPVAFTLNQGDHYSYPLKWYSLARTFGVVFGNHQGIQSAYNWWETNIKDKEMPHADTVCESFPFK
jgi:hypothetical protein